MTFKEFELHRPRLARSLAEFAGTNYVSSVLPEYEDDQLFSALIEDGTPTGAVAVCVKSTHPAAMYEEDTPGEPTWWWEDDLNSL